MALVTRMFPVVTSFLLGATAPPHPSVTLNGVAVDGLTNQRLENCTLVFDALGNIAVEAPGYSVQKTVGPTVSSLTSIATAGVKPGPAMAPSAARVSQVGPVAASAAVMASLGKRYYLVVEQSAGKSDPLNLSVFVNTKWIREIKGNDPQSVVELTSFLKLGPNKVTLSSSRIEGAKDWVSAPVHLIVGEGVESPSGMTFQNPALDVRKNPAELEKLNQDFILNAR